MNTIVLNSHAPTANKRNASNDTFCNEIEQAFDQFSKYNVNILLEDFIAKFEACKFLKLKIGHEILHANTNVEGARVASFAI
jgi:hypothetical protein